MKRSKGVFLYVLITAVVALVITMVSDNTKDYTSSEFSAVSAPLSVHFIDVGQADSVYIKLPDGRDMLIDAGETEDAGTVASYLRDCGADRLDFVVGTHPHVDHIGGLSYVLDRFGAEVLYMPDAYSSTKTFEELLDTIEKNHIDTRIARKGVEIARGDDYKVQILSPVSQAYEDTNNYSVVVRIEYRDTAFLFMGDAEKYVEQELLDSYTNLRADVLKVGHHGSSTSSDEDFIKAVNPSVAVISSGKDNSYGHPHREVVTLLDKLDITTLRTDMSGNVVVGSNGSEIIY